MSVLRIFRNLAVLVIVAVGGVSWRLGQAVAQDSATCRGSVACGAHVRSCSFCGSHFTGHCDIVYRSCYDVDLKVRCLRTTTLCPP